MSKITQHIVEISRRGARALEEGANVRAGNPKAYGNDLAASQTGFNKKPREDDEYHNSPKPKFKAKSLMDRPHDVHIDGKKWKSFNNGHQAHAAANTLQSKGKKATAVARFHEEAEITEVDTKTLQNYIRGSSGDVQNRQYIANRSGGTTDAVKRVIAKRNAGQATAQRKLDKIGAAKAAADKKLSEATSARVRLANALERARQAEEAQRKRTEEMMKANAAKKEPVKEETMKTLSAIVEEAKSTHPDAVHVQPVKVNGQTKYKVHAVGKNFAHGIKVGEHLSDSELDDFSDMGGKIKHVK